MQEGFRRVLFYRILLDFHECEHFRGSGLARGVAPGKAQRVVSAAFSADVEEDGYAASQFVEE
ncbi:hypothetical protein PsorP6_001345 [Peronosclerospora sorghi]|uniref:Uncharacterized protein n=1 Tax=Peronosclerospora sorghi TaxID=230839 RepID=A0ACC0WUL3_9STRA|nr:hypothetical protein PsorP6_001345 [Peronosclerospora sorghi]